MKEVSLYEHGRSVIFSKAAEFKEEFRGKSVTSASAVATADAKQVMDIDAFETACACNGRIEFGTFVALFNKDRRRSCLERLFTPSSLTRIMNMAQSDRGANGDDMVQGNPGSSGFSKVASTAPGASPANAGFEERLGKVEAIIPKFDDAVTKLDKLSSQDALLKQMPYAQYASAQPAVEITEDLLAKKQLLAFQRELAQFRSQTDLLLENVTKSSNR